MPALDPETRERWRDMVVVDRESATVGTITAFFLDQVSGLPTWALVHTGWLRDRQAFVPLADAVEADGEVRLPYTRTQVNQAPEIDPGGELTADHELALSGHYGLLDHHGAVAEAAPERRQPAQVAPKPDPPWSGPPVGERSPSPGREDSAVHSPPAAGQEGTGVVVTRSEEELRVGVRTRLRRLRVRRYVVTEYVTRTIPVRREKVRLEEVRSDQVMEGGADAWEPPGAAGEPELEVVLRREEPVIGVRAVPVERVRLVRRVVTDQRTVTGELRKEQVEVDEDPTRP
jgi:stress response protein YsnF